MAITNGYATLEEYRDYHQVESISSVDDGVVEALLEGVSRYIDEQSGRTFYARTETRYYSVPGSRELRFDDDLLTITTLTNGNAVVISSDDYYFLPRNVSPKFGLKLKEASSVAWYPDSDNNYEYVISIAGTWGYSATRPDNINTACLEIAKSAYGRRSGQFSDSVARLTSAGVIATPRDVSSFAMAIIASYRRRT